MEASLSKIKFPIENENLVSEVTKRFKENIETVVKTMLSEREKQPAEYPLFIVSENESSKPYVKKMKLDITVSPHHFLCLTRTKEEKVWEDRADIECYICKGTGNIQCINCQKVFDRVISRKCEECKGSGRLSLKEPFEYTTSSITEKELESVLNKNGRIEMLLCFPDASEFVKILKHLSGILDFFYKEEDTGSDYYDIRINDENFSCDWKHLSSEEVQNVSEILSEKCKLSLEARNVMRETVDNKETHYYDYYRVLSVEKVKM